MEIVDCAEHRLIRLAGRLGEAQVPELLEVHAGAGIITLDLSELISADSVGFEVLERLRRDGAELRAVPAYIQLKLDGVAKRAPQRNR